MTKINKYIVVVAAVLAAFVAAPVQAQVTPFMGGDGFLYGWGAVSTHAPILIRYTGTGAGGTVTVAAGGDITLSIGAVGASAVDTTVECDGTLAASGARSGIIDVSDGACDTLGEVVDAINSQTDNWRAVILDGQRSDSSNNSLITLAETAANSVDGLALLADSTVYFKQILTVGNWACPVGETGAATSCSHPRSMRFYIPGNRTALKFNPNPWAGKTRAVFKLAGTSTYSSGTSALQLLCVATTYRTPPAALTAATPTHVVSSETVSTFSVPGGATTVAATIDTGGVGYACPKGQKMLGQINNSAVMSASILYIAGITF